MAKLNLTGKSQTPGKAWRSRTTGAEESVVVIRDNEWLTGICDKKQMGAKSHGVVYVYRRLLKLVTTRRRSRERVSMAAISVVS